MVVHNAFPSRGDCLALEQRRKVGRYEGENARIDDNRDAASLSVTIRLVRRDGIDVEPEKVRERRGGERRGGERRDEARGEETKVHSDAKASKSTGTRK